LRGDQRLQKYSQIIIDQNKRLNEQVEKVLNLARLEKDNFKLNKQSFDISEVLQSIVSAEHLKMKEKGVGQIQLEESTHQQFITGDKLHFTNVIYNIIDNAIKYCTLIPEVFIKTYLDGKNVAIEIKDNGIGIKSEHFDHLFKKFYRIPTGDVHDVKGFGLGLYYVQNICYAHGWDITVKSDIGKGSIFKITIPYES